MKWLKKLINPTCLCCGEIATKNVREIPSGEHILYELIRYEQFIVPIKRYQKIVYKYSHTHLANYPLCTNCYSKVETKWQEDKAKSEALEKRKRKELELNNHYEKLALEVERKELELRAKSLGIETGFKSNE